MFVGVRIIQEGEMKSFLLMTPSLRDRLKTFLGDCSRVRILSIYGLSRDFARGEVSQMQKRIYGIGFLILSGWTWIGYLTPPLGQQLPYFIHDLAWALFGIVIFYIENRKVDRAEFVWRVAAFSFVSFLYLLAFTELYFGFLLISFLKWIQGMNLNLHMNHFLDWVVTFLLMAPYHLCWIILVRIGIKRIGLIKRELVTTNESPKRAY